MTILGLGHECRLIPVYGNEKLLVPYSSVSIIARQGSPGRGFLMQQFGAKIRDLRKRAGLTQDQLSYQIAIAGQSHLAKLEADQDPPSLAVALHLAEVFAVSLDYLLRDETPLAAPDELPPSGQGLRAIAHFGPQLRSRRLAHGLSQGDIAKQLGLTWRGHVSNLESGRKQPSISLLLNTADVFAVATDELLLPINAP